MFITARIDSIFFFSTAVHIYNFHIFTAIIHHLEGFVWIQHNDQIPTSLLAQLVERSTGIAEVMGSNPVQAWIFSKYEDRFYIRRVIKYYQLSWERKLATAKSLKADVSSVSDWRRADARSVNLQSLWGGQFTFSIQLITLNYPFIISHRRSTTVSLETHALNADKLLKTAGAVGWTRLSNCTVRYRKRSVFIKSFILWLIQQVVDIIYLDPLSLVIFLLTVHHWYIYIYSRVSCFMSDNDGWC